MYAAYLPSAWIISKNLHLAFVWTTSMVFNIIEITEHFNTNYTGLSIVLKYV